MSRHLARMVISTEFLRQAMRLPKDAVIHRVYMPEDTYYGIPHFEMVVEHPDLPPVLEGCRIPIACPAIETEYVEVPKFKSWGIGGK